MDNLLSSTSEADIAINKAIKVLVTKARRNKQVSFILSGLLISLSGLIVVHILQFNMLLAATIIVILLIISTYIFLKSTSYNLINPPNILEHINRHFPECQESAQLLLTTPKSLSTLQQLQLQNIKDIFLSDRYSKSMEKCIPGVNLKYPFIFTIITMLLFLASTYQTSIFSLVSNYFFETHYNATAEQNIKSREISTPKLLGVNINITPPSYTGLKAYNTKQPNITIVEGSIVEWRLKFSHDNTEYFFVSGENGQKQFTKTDSGNYQLTQVITQTNIYRFTYQDNSTENNKNGNYSLPGVYSITVEEDKAPKIKIITPNVSLFEIPLGGEASFNMEVIIIDDYGISHVDILASVAKGSGEAVKFRDKKFTFNEYKDSESGRKYRKHWSLADLDMEPGDEAYFSIIASDNKLPEAQQSKSTSVIVRWLDDEELDATAADLRINFIPELFRSQRQIIIETEQLIADKKDMLESIFKDKSIDLGHSQGDLKHKYGQYLGDEIDEGISVGELTADESDHDKSEEEHGPEVGHLHEEMIDNNDLSGRSQLIARFAHNHGDAEIGPISKRDPKSWMRRAVSEMWKAELYLKTAEPDKALPYEYQAYQYLKLARQADRVYVKRLGFEPPPVNEDRRLTGELLDILNPSLSIEDRPDDKSDTALFRNVHHFLNGSPEVQSLSEFQKGLLNKLRARLLFLATSRPALIRYAATIEKILIANNVVLSDCDGCVAQLKNKLWRLLPSSVSLPAVKIRSSYFQIENEKSYLDQIKQLKAKDIVVESDRGATDD